MAEALFLVRRTTQGVNNDRNLVREVIINSDDGGTDADVIAEAISGLNAQNPVEAGAEAVYPADYFDTVEDIGDLTSGPLATDEDFIAFPPRVSAITT